MIEARLEELEEGSYSVQPLSEVISIEQAGDESTTIHEVGVQIKVRKAPKSIPLPATTEELRSRFRTLAISYILAAYKHGSRLWIKTATFPVFNTYVEYLLSDQVALYHMDQEGISIKASWTTVLNFDLAMRKYVVRAVLYDSKDFATALVEATKDLQIRERYFITPTAMLNSASKGKPTVTAAIGDTLPVLSAKKRKQAWVEAQKEKRAKGGKGQAKGSDKSIAKGKGKGKKFRKTPDGRSICDFFNKASGCKKSDSECTWVHCCSSCLGPHPATACPSSS